MDYICNPFGGDIVAANNTGYNRNPLFNTKWIKDYHGNHLVGVLILSKVNESPLKNEKYDYQKK